MRLRYGVLLCSGVACLLSGQIRPSSIHNIQNIGTTSEGFSPPAVKAIAAGGNHSVILASDATVWAWGSNSEGQLGNGGFQAPPEPAEVYGLGGVAAISAGFAHTLALKSDGTVWAWGKNREGQLGDGTTVTRSKPIQVPGLSGVLAVAAGNSHGLAIRNDGTVWAWGWPGAASGTATGPATPSPVHGLTSVTAIAAGQAHSLALRSDGTVWAWGDNSYGQSGNATVSFLSLAAPNQVAGLTGVTAIAAGYQHSMALKSDGSVWVWGHDGAFSILQPTPVEVTGLTDVRAIAAGCGTSLAVKGDGTVWQWGLDTVPRPWSAVPELKTPTQVLELTGIQTVSLPFGGSHGLALQRDGTAWEWGSYRETQLGWATMAHPAPRQIALLSGVVAVSGGLALKNDGTVWGWDPPFNWGWTDRSMPFPVGGLSEVVAIASGTTGYNLALKNSGTVWNVSGSSALFQVPNLTGAVVVAAGESRALAVKRDGTVWEWSGVDSEPVQVSELSGAAAVAEAFDWWWEDGEWIRSVALKRDGTVWTWDGVISSRSAPVQVSGLSGITAIAGGQISLALKGDGTVWQWDAAAGDPAPRQVSGLAGVTAIAIGSPHIAMAGDDAHALALKTDGTVWAWGPNEFGQLGDGTTAYRASPVQVAALSDAAAIAAAGYSSVAVKRDGTVWSWGAGTNRYGSTWSLPARVPPLGAPDLGLSLGHSSDFRIGGLGVYNLTLANRGRSPTFGDITVTDTLPPGLTFVSGVGNGWICSAADRIVVCTNPGPINPDSSTMVTLTVRVEPQAYPGVTNLATVSNQSDFNLWNNTIGDPTVVLPGTP